MAGLLLRSGASVQAANRYGVSPLVLACANGSDRMIDLLVAIPASEHEVPAKVSFKRNGKFALLESPDVRIDTTGFIKRKVGVRCDSEVYIAADLSVCRSNRTCASSARYRSAGSENASKRERRKRVTREDLVEHLVIRRTTE